MNNKPFISVVLSFRNEEEVLPELIRRLHNSLEPLKINYELIFVNDASTDNSLKILMEKAEDDKHIKIINMSRRFGAFPCILAGMKYSKGSAVIYMDADLQDPPEIIPQLIDKWQEGADVVYTTRIARNGESAIKKWVTKLGYRILSFTSEDIKLPLDSGDFKLLSRRVIDELLKLKEKDPFPKGLIPWVGFRQVPVFYRRERRFAGKTHCPFLGGDTIKRFIYGLISFSSLPLYTALFMGFIIFLVTFIYLIIIIVRKYLGFHMSTWSMVMLAVLFLGGIQLLTIGILGSYLGRIYNEVKNRPQYIIESTFGFKDE